MKPLRLFDVGFLAPALGAALLSLPATAPAQGVDEAPSAEQVPGAPVPVEPQAPRPPAEVEREPIPGVDEGRVVTLQEMLKSAETESYELVVLRERLEQADVSVRRAWSNLLPTATASATYTRNSTAAEIAFPNFAAGFVPSPDNPDVLVPAEVTPVEIQPQNSVTAILRAQVPILVMPAYYGIAASETSLEATEKNITFARNELFLSISQAYYGAVAARRLIDVSQALVETATEQERVARARFEVGEIAKVGYLRASVQRAQAEKDVVRATNAYQSAKLALTQLTGIQPPYQVEQPEPVEIPQGTRDELVRAGLENRKDLQASRLFVNAAEKALKASWWQFAPSVIGQGQVLWANAAGFTGEETTWQVGITALLTIFDASYYSDIRENRSQLRQVAAQSSNLSRQVVREVQDAMLELESAQANLEKAREQVRLAEENSSLVHAQYDAGAATYLDVTDADNTLFASRVSEVTESLNTEVAALRLSRAIGKFGVERYP